MSRLSINILHPCREVSSSFKHSVTAEKDVPATNSVPSDGRSDKLGQNGVKSQSSQKHLPSKPLQPAILQPFLEKATDAESKQHYKMAASLYEQVDNTEKAKCYFRDTQTLASGSQVNKRLYMLNQDSLGFSSHKPSSAPKYRQNSWCICNYQPAQHRLLLYSLQESLQMNQRYVLTMLQIY